MLLKCQHFYLLICIEIIERWLSFHYLTNWTWLKLSNNMYIPAEKSKKEGFASFKTLSYDTLMHWSFCKFQHRHPCQCLHELSLAPSPSTLWCLVSLSSTLGQIDWMWDAMPSRIQNEIMSTHLAKPCTNKGMIAIVPFVVLPHNTAENGLLTGKSFLVQQNQARVITYHVWYGQCKQRIMSMQKMVQIVMDRDTGYVQKWAYLMIAISKRWFSIKTSPKVGNTTISKLDIVKKAGMFHK